MYLPRLIWPVLSAAAVSALLAVLLWPAAAQSQSDGDAIAPLTAGWNNVVYDGDSLPIEDALNDALPIVETVTRWSPLAAGYDTWNKGAPSIAITLPELARGDVLWLETSDAGDWTQIGAAQAGQPGPAGLSCWDLDGDGEFDPEEDAEVDGVADALDCRGPVGPRGLAGPAEIPGYEIVSVFFSIAAGDTQFVEAPRPASKQVLGGGYFFALADTTNPPQVLGDGPNLVGFIGIEEPERWEVLIDNGGARSAASGFVYGICAGPDARAAPLP